MKNLCRSWWVHIIEGLGMTGRWDTVNAVHVMYINIIQTYHSRYICYVLTTSDKLITKTAASFSFFFELKMLNDEQPTNLRKEYGHKIITFDDSNPHAS